MPKQMHGKIHCNLCQELTYKVEDSYATVNGNTVTLHLECIKTINLTIKEANTIYKLIRQMREDDVV